MGTGMGKDKGRELELAMVKAMAGMDMVKLLVEGKALELL